MFLRIYIIFFQCILSNAFSELMAYSIIRAQIPRMQISI